MYEMTENIVSIMQEQDMKDEQLENMKRLLKNQNFHQQTTIQFKGQQCRKSPKKQNIKIKIETKSRKNTNIKFNPRRSTAH